MNIQVYDEETVRLKLQALHGGGAVLQAVDEEGNALFCGNLLTVYPNGSIKRNPAVGEQIGIKREKGSTKINIVS